MKQTQRIPMMNNSENMFNASSRSNAKSYIYFTSCTILYFFECSTSK